MFDWLFRGRAPVSSPVPRSALVVTSVRDYGCGDLYVVIEYEGDLARFRSLIRLIGAGGRIRRRPQVGDEVHRIYGPSGWALFIGGEEFIHHSEW